MASGRSASSVSRADYETLAAWRHALRRFLHFSAAAARDAGVPPEQHQALLAIKGYPGPDRPTIGDLAERLDRRHHSAVGLVDRMERRRLVRRVVDSQDRRRIHLELTAQGEALVARLSAVHKDELRRIGPELRALLGRLGAGEEAPSERRQP